jgi:predicted ribosomally synthesized peptide with SipW-like signal peptide
MSTSKKVLRTLVVLGLLGALAAVGAFSAFSSETSNPGNQITAGTVALDDNDSDQALYNLPNAKPGDSATRCIRVTYNGSLPADVRIYRPDPVGALATHVNLAITPGSGVAQDCSDFSADAGGPVFNSLLQSLPTTYAGGVVDYPGAGSVWNTGNAVTYRFVATLDVNAPNSAQGATTGLHAIRWEARNQ